MSNYYENDLPEELSEELLLNEEALIAGLLEAAEFRSDRKRMAKAQIKRDGKPLFEFRVHPLSEEDGNEIRKRCTRTAPDPRGPRYGKIETDVNYIRMRSMKIYEATAEEGRSKLWDNPVVQRKLSCLDPVEVIEQVLMAGEKDGVIDLIDRISGFGEPLESLEDHAKN